MARILRRELPDGYFHLTANAVHETWLFRDGDDYRAFVALLLQGARRWSVRLHAYCLMGTHYHAVVDARVEDLSRAVQWIQSHYAREHNARFGRKGALFRQRFSSWVIHDEEHYENTLDYILDNPVRAGIVDRREDWPWSAVRRKSEHLFPHDRTAKLACYGSRRACRSRRPGAQPQGHHGPAPASQADLRHRPLGLREVEPCFRHDLRGRPAPLRGIALGLRPPVPPDDGETGRGLDRRPQPRDLDRPEDDQPKPEVHRRDGHGDLRLPAPALRARRPPALPDLRSPDRRPVDRGDREPDPAAPGGHALHRQRPRRARPERRVQGPPGRAPPRRLHQGQGGRRAAPPRRRDHARQEVQAHDRGRGRPSPDEGRAPQPALPVRRDRRQPCRRPRRHRPARRGEGAHVLRAVRLPRARRLPAGAPAPDLLVQLAPRRLPALHRPRRPAGDRSRPPGPGPDAAARRGARPAERQLVRGRHPGDRRPVRDRPGHALAGPDRGAAGLLPPRHQGRADLRQLPEPDGPEAFVHAGVRRPRHESAAPLPRDRLVVDARADRGVHELPALPGVQRRPPQARGAGGHRRRQQHPRVHEDVRHPRARVPGRARPDGDGAADRRADRQGDPRATDLPRQRRGRVPPTRPRLGDALRRRGPAPPPRDTDREPARRCPLHPRRAVDRAPPARQRKADRRRSTGSATSATPCSSWSTTSR